MNQTVDAICKALVDHHLVAKALLDDARTSWIEQFKGDPNEGLPFGEWLIDLGYITAYQLDFVRRGVANKLWFNEYLLLDRAGVGAMAGVYKAVHRGGQILAIKILPKSKAKEPELLARFQREARLAIRFKHPNVVRTFAMGEANELHYIVMEFLDGETLLDVLKRRRRISADEAVRIAQQALGGLQNLLDHDVVHRDIKPANLMLVPARLPNEPDTTLNATVKLLDVGLGRALFDEGAEGAGPVELTAAGDLLGTATYMAPEQARDARKADVRSDLYSLGCVLYHAVTGQPPFVDKNTTRILLRHATEAPKPVRELNPEVPVSLEGLIMHMLEKDPARRPPTPQNAIRDLLNAGFAEPKAGTVPELNVDATLAGQGPPLARPVARPVGKPGNNATVLEADVARADAARPVKKVISGRLIVKEGAKEQSFSLKAGVTIVGREDGSQVCIPHPTVSRRHCMFSWEKGVLFVEDLKSTAGTIVNGAKITGRQAVATGSLIKIGMFVLQAIYGVKRVDADTAQWMSNELEQSDDDMQATESDVSAIVKASNPSAAPIMSSEVRNLLSELDDN